MRQERGAKWKRKKAIPETKIESALDRNDWSQKNHN